MKIIPTILAGGRGERFWPLSRIKTPKQCLNLLSNNPMIKDTYERLKEFGNFSIVANPRLCNDFRKILPKHVNYIEEPFARNTAPAIGLACISLMKNYGDCIIFLETADHFYKDPDFYLSEIKKSCSFVEKSNKIALIGIKPTEPHTGYGYIKNGELITENESQNENENKSDNFYKVSSFKEKPDLNTAKKYFKDEKYSWNSGMFIAKCSVLLKEFKIYLPEIYKGLQRIKENNFDKEILTEEFQKMKRISIDFGIMEKSKNTIVLQSSMHWDDIGDFNAIARISNPNENNNYSKNNIKSIDSEENIIISDKLVALIGVKNLIVVDTNDALLVCHRSETQKIKNLIRKLNEKYL